jgi:hypothetical protein
MSDVKNEGTYIDETFAESYSSEIFIARFHRSETKNFFSLSPTSHYCNQINFPLRFHISHARTRTASLKGITSLRDASEYPTGICDGEDAVSNINIHDINIFNVRG